ncbi:RIC1-domain-containing protein [Aulographum hederae CBS 113979]|uniref:RIC1-domain-containing protein n=1 Tax=Aulographum hederae CBS 113979 TaxID=1176131 RepID=A0A6G1GVC0_9PEZI|nr:RIC1-domain-containing protein [Aulographum hederae CBS 113979]
MYWALGAPRCYVFSEDENNKKHSVSHDESGSHNAVDPNPDPTPLESLDDEEKLGNSNSGKDDKAAEEEHSSNQQESQEQQSGGIGLLNNGEHKNIVGIQPTRSGQMFATITATSLSVWQTKPTTVLSSLTRSDRSLKSYGLNVAILLRPDSGILVVQTSLGYLITYTLATDPSSKVYKPFFSEGGSGYGRRHSIAGAQTQPGMELCMGPGEAGGSCEVDIRFRMVIKIDAGISKAIALDDELVVTTSKPAAVQCIRWSSETADNQTSTELLARMPWLQKKSSIIEMIHDRPMNLSTWITSDGRAYAVQRTKQTLSSDEKSTMNLFRGYCFHTPETKSTYGTKAAINARFSLIALGCANGEIHVYTARDYNGHIPISHKLRPSDTGTVTGKLNFLSYSPDGYCLIAGFERGWMTWSVYGKPGGNSFSADRNVSKENGEIWLLSVADGFWIGGGSQLLLLAPNDDRLWVLDMARSAVAGCFSAANVARSLLQTDTGFMIYRGYELPDLTTISGEYSLWHHVQIPSTYLQYQWPIRSAVISPDGRYVAVAGRRGLAHYSVHSGRWKTFDDPLMENEFTVRGGMCWHQHLLIAAVESSQSYELRIFSREQPLDNAKAMCVERLAAPIVLLTPSGDDSLLVYTYENILYHYMINVTQRSVKLVQVGQIAFHGIIRAPPRVRAISWILPEDQLDHGDPSQDVAVAMVLFLVDGKLVLLQPATSEKGELKYEMRIIAQNVEYYSLMRDQPSFRLDDRYDSPLESSYNPVENGFHGHDLKDSLWYFDGNDMRLWVDIQDVLATASLELGRELPESVNVAVDFYPLSVLLNKGIFFGVESELIQRRDIDFAFYRFTTRTHLFLPPLLRHHLSQYNSPAALHLSQHYQHLDYFPHALEILLHDILDDEVDAAPPAEQALLPSTLSFLSSFPEYLDIVVQCTRKTEVRSWRTLFAHLPPPQDLFEESLSRGSLKTAGGYLLVLHTFDELSSSSQQLIKLLQRAKDEQDWDLCKELARFLMALDESGATLGETLEILKLKSPTDGFTRDTSLPGDSLTVPHSYAGAGAAARSVSGLGLEMVDGPSESNISRSPGSAGSTKSPLSGHGSDDYFSHTTQSRNVG